MPGQSKTYYRRNLPHWQPPGAAIFLTWHLDGSLPRSARERLSATRALLGREAARAGEDPDQRQARHSKKQFAVLDQILDKAESGPLWLKQERIAGIVEAAMLSRYRELYTLWAYVVMANHVYTLLQPKPAPASIGGSTAEPVYVPLKDITKRLKGYTALEANRLLGRTGQRFWRQESFDHWARDEAEFYRIIAYIEDNPVKAGLVPRPDQWRWSSAHERLQRGWNEIRPLT
jgi:REP element-mobilizing transposase RayT